MPSRKSAQKTLDGPASQADEVALRSTSHTRKRGRVRIRTRSGDREGRIQCPTCGAGARTPGVLCAACTVGKCRVGWGKSRCRGIGTTQVFIASSFHLGSTTKLCLRHSRKARPRIWFYDGEIAKSGIASHWVLEYSDYEGLGLRGLGELREELTSESAEVARREAAEYLGCSQDEVTVEE